jgi:hypothetical protein
MEELKNAVDWTKTVPRVAAPETKRSPPNTDLAMEEPDTNQPTLYSHKPILRNLMVLT